MLFRKYYTVKDVAERLGVSSMTVLRWERIGNIPKIRRHPKNNWRIFTEEDISKIKLLKRDY